MATVCAERDAFAKICRCLFEKGEAWLKAYVQDLDDCLRSWHLVIFLNRLYVVETLQDASFDTLTHADICF